MSERSKQMRKLALEFPDKAIAKMVIEFADYMDFVDIKRKELDGIIERQQKRIAELEYQLAEAKSLQSYNHHILKLQTEKQELFATIEKQQERIEELEQLYSEAIKLLDAAMCPCCDKSGAYYDNNGEVCQCQWCDEVSRLPRPPKEKDDE